MTRVLLLFGATPDPSAAILAAFGHADAREAFSAALRGEVELVMITWQEPPATVPGIAATIALAASRRTPLDAFFASIGAHALRDRLARFPAGRLLNSLGPADAARTFWRTLRHDPAAIALTGPDVVAVAGDLAATRAAWQLLHSARAARGLYGLRAATDELSRGRAA